MHEREVCSICLWNITAKSCLFQQSLPHAAEKIVHKMIFHILNFPPLFLKLPIFRSQMKTAARNLLFHIFFLNMSNDLATISKNFSSVLSCPDIFLVQISANFMFWTKLHLLIVLFSLLEEDCQQLCLWLIAASL